MDIDDRRLANNSILDETKYDKSGKTIGRNAVSDNDAMSSLASSSCKTSLGQRYYQLLITEKYSDCSFSIDDRIFKAHKLILSTASPVFEAMLYGPLNDDQKTIQISDISPEGFYKMLVFLYSGELTLKSESLESAIELYYCSEKYLLMELKQISLNAIKSKLRFDNILQTLDLAFYTNLEALIKMCLQFFEQYCMSSDSGASKFMTTIKSSYYHLSKDCINEMLNSSLAQNYKKYLYGFVNEWIRNDFKEKRKSNSISEQSSSCDGESICDDINCRLNQVVGNKIDSNCVDEDKPNNYPIEQVTYIERTYYKARPPFVISATNRKFVISIKSNQYMSLIGLILHSRLKPNPMAIDVNHSRGQVITRSLLAYSNNDSYKESLKVEIYSISTDGEGQQNEILEHNQSLDEKLFIYNCDINVALSKQIILTPDEEYIIKFVWDNGTTAGAEYPCSLMSNTSGAISFDDRSTYGNGSILKGLKLLSSEIESAKAKKNN